MTELEELKQQAQTILNRISELEKKHEEPETFESLIKLITEDLENESFDDLDKLEKHTLLYRDLKRIEGYVNRKFRGKIEWDKSAHKFGIIYDYNNSSFGFYINHHQNQGIFYFISEEARSYFIKVCKDKLIQFFKTSH